MFGKIEPLGRNKASGPVKRAKSAAFLYPGTRLVRFVVCHSSPGLTNAAVDGCDGEGKPLAASA
jgi:hypothetical protein